MALKLNDKQIDVLKEKIKKLDDDEIAELMELLLSDFTVKKLYKNELRTYIQRWFYEKGFYQSIRKYQVLKKANDKKALKRKEIK